jgi:flavin-dependent dehydrogenase
MVGNGVIITGDAACLVNPIHGGGIGPSMISGFQAGKVAIEALEKGDASRHSLWPYNKRYNDLYGAKQAKLDIFRMLLIASRDEDLNYGMHYNLMTEQDVLKTGLGDEFHLNITETSRRVFRGLKRVGFLNRLRLTVKYMNRVRGHYAKYPDSPSAFEKWRLQTTSLFDEAASKVMK